jgi:hypothetical protein
VPRRRPVLRARFARSSWPCLGPRVLPQRLLPLPLRRWRQNGQLVVAVRHSTRRVRLAWRLSDGRDWHHWLLVSLLGGLVARSAARGRHATVLQGDVRQKTNLRASAHFSRRQYARPGFVFRFGVKMHGFSTLLTPLYFFSTTTTTVEWT